jgi:CDP-diacylglycerol---glycerol-3-phosphate 3-phosphatidyltransferase
VAPRPSLFAACLSAAFLSDVFDGILARRLGVATTALRRLDSVADTVFYVAATGAVWLLHPSAITGHLGGLLALVVLELARYALDLAKFHREASYHMWSAKGWGIALFLAFVAVLAFGRTGWPVSLAIALGIVTDLEGLAISLVLPAWRHDVPTLVHALRMRRAARSS